MNALGAGTTEAKPILHVVEDDVVFCRAIAQLFGSVGMETRCHFSPSEFLQHFDAARPGCILIDVRLPGMSGLELHERILEQGWSHAVIFLTGHAEITTAVRAMKAGAVDFLQKPANEQMLIETVTAAVNGHVEVFKAEQRVNEIRRRLRLLSPREREVLQWVVAGKSTKQIARELGLSHKTVDNHRASILDKMRAAGVVELVRLVLTAEPEMLNADSSEPTLSFAPKPMSKAS